MRDGPTPLTAHMLAAWSSGDAGLVADFLASVRRYQASTWTRPASKPGVLLQFGTMQLLDYGLKSGKPILVIPSLINPSWVLDLLPDNSLMAWLVNQGFRPLMIDWGVPDAFSRSLDMNAVVEQLLVPALAAIGTPVPLLGYCLGGTLAVALAAHSPDRVSALALMATPWAWSGYDTESCRELGQLMHTWEPALNQLGVLPAEQLQMLFAHLDPQLIVRKFAKFADVEAGSHAEHTFFAMEDWSNTGPPLAAPVARQLFGDWIAHGINGWPGIDLSTLVMPALVITASADRIVPETTTRPLASALTKVTHMPVAAGHVGMVVGAKASELLWEPLTAWLQAID